MHNARYMPTQYTFVFTTRHAAVNWELDAPVARFIRSAWCPFESSFNRPTPAAAAAASAGDGDGVGRIQVRGFT